MTTLIQAMSVGIRERVEFDGSKVIFPATSAGIADRRKYKGPPVLIRFFEAGIDDQPVLRDARIIRVK